MKTKLWERTAFRIIIFFLCALFVSGSVCIALLGGARLADSNASNNSTFILDPFDAFSDNGFEKSETLKGTVSSATGTLIGLYQTYMESGGADFEEAEWVDREVSQELWDLYDTIWNDIENRRQMIYAEMRTTEVSSDGTLSAPRLFTEGPNDGLYFWDFVDPSGYRYGNLSLTTFDARKIIENPTFVDGGRMKDFGEDGVREAFEEVFPEQVAFIRQVTVESRTRAYEATLDMLEGTRYFIGDGKSSVSNVPLGPDGYPKDTKALTDGTVWVTIQKDNTSGSLNTGNSWIIGSSATLYIAWTDDTLAEYERLYYAGIDDVRAYFGVAAALMILAIVCFVLLLVFTGRKRPAFEDTRKLWALDRIFVEIQAVLLFIAIFIGLIGIAELLYRLTDDYISWVTESETILLLVGPIGFAVGLFTLWFALSLVRTGKAGLFAQRSLIGLFVLGPCRTLADTTRSAYDGRNPLAKTVPLLVLFWFLTAMFAGFSGLALVGGGAAWLVFVILGILTLAGAIAVSCEWAKRYEKLRKGISEIAGGNLGYGIEITGNGRNEFDRLSALVNEIGSAQNLAIQNELKNQRLKTDLISNVSHDLKTPLTSILTYTDLLKTEGLKSKNAGEYLRIIDEKGRRLQKLTEDLFDAAKASSGAMTVHKEKVDLLALLRQEIGEMNGSFAEAELELEIGADKDHYYVEADSQLLWRVVDNLLRNARKYAQPGTRVYIDLKEHEKMITMEIKNISQAKLNMHPDELMERFKRGDESRATEGSGLGLAIAKDLVRLQNGQFDIFIDGDLFKAVVTLPPYVGLTVPEPKMPESAL